MKLAPTLAQVLVRVIPHEEKQTEGGIIIQANARADYMRGEILTVGPLVKTAEIQPGRVLRWREKTGIAMRHANITHPYFEGSPPVRPAPGRPATSVQADDDCRIVNEESALCVEVPE